MADTDTVYLQLQHGANYTDLPSGKRWTTSAPIQPVPKARAADLLRETLPLYQGETSRTVRRFKAVPAPPPAEPGRAAPPRFDEGVERSAAEIDAEIEAATSGTGGAAEAGTERTPAEPGEKTEVTGGQRQRQRLPRDAG